MHKSSVSTGSAGQTALSYNRSLLYRLHIAHTENTSHVIATKKVQLHAECCLATSYNIRPLRHSFHCCSWNVFTEPIA
jgi:hypothetical protein